MTRRCVFSNIVVVLVQCAFIGSGESLHPRLKGVKPMIHDNSGKQQFTSQKRPEFVPGLLVVKIKQDVVSSIPDIGTMSAAAARLLQLPGRVNEPFQSLRRNKTLREVVPVFIRSGATLSGGAQGTSAAAIFAASVRDSESEDLRGINVLRLSKSADLDAIEKELGKTGALEYIHRAPARWATGLIKRPVDSADPLVNRQWGLRAIRWFDSAPLPDASNVKVAVLDTGVDTTHPDLKPVVQSYVPGGASSQDIVGHGTHVAGIMAASADNHIGIAGICRCDLHVWKIFGDTPAPDGEYYVDELLYQRALNAARNEKVRVVNLSIGGTRYTQTEALLIGNLVSAGTVVVAAMGNEYHPFNPAEYPASYPGVIAVGAINELNRRASFSNTGKHIAISAPGTNILSTLPMKASAYRTKEETQYAAWSGTSMATPHVTAAVALMIARSPGMGPDEVTKKLKATATKLPAMKKKKTTVEYGAGLLNLKDALS